MSEPSIRSEHHLIVSRSDASGGDPSVLLLSDAAGWSLPRIESDERRSADVAELNHAARAALGAEVSVLRCLADEAPEGGQPRQHVYAMDTHAVDWTPPPHARWHVGADLASLDLAWPRQREWLASWLAQRGARGAASAGRDWIVPGWRNRIMAWARVELARCGSGPVVEIFSPSLLVLHLDDTDVLAGVANAQERIRAAYLAPWRESGPLSGWPAARLERAFDLAQPVAMVHYAAQFWLGLPRIETSWEVRAFLPFFLRRLIEGVSRQGLE